MKKILVKDHAVLGKKGDEVEVSEGRANYLERVGAVDSGKGHKKEAKVVEQDLEHSEPVEQVDDKKKKAGKKK